MGEFSVVRRVRSELLGDQRLGDQRLGDQRLGDLRVQLDVRQGLSHSCPPEGLPTVPSYAPGTLPGISTLPGGSVMFMLARYCLRVGGA